MPPKFGISSHGLSEATGVVSSQHISHTEPFVNIALPLLLFLPSCHNRRMKSLAAKSLPFLIVFACAVLPWIDTLNYPFLLDDQMTVVTNPLLAGGKVDASGIFTSTGWGDVPEYSHVANYRPLSLLTVALTRAVSGLNPVPFRVTNVALYAILCLMVLWLILSFGAHPAVATLAAAWFALHGTHVETVMFVVNREIMLASIFYVGGLLLVVRRSGFGRSAARDDGSAGSPGRQAAWTPASLAALGLISLAGMMSKESAVTMPFAAAVITLVSRPRGVPVRARVLPVVVLGVSVAVYFAIRYAALGRVMATVIPWQDNPLVLTGTTGRLAGAMQVLGEATRLLLAPFNMTVDYSFDVLGLPGPPPGAPWPAILTGVLIIVATVVAFVAALKRHSPAWAGILVMALSWGLVSSIVFPSWIILGERLLTEPSIGMAVAIAAAIEAIRVRKAGSPSVATLAACTILACWALMQGALTLDRIPDFRSGERLYQSSLANRPGSTRLYNNLGNEMVITGRWAEAEPYLRAAIAIDPANAEAHVNLGLVLANAGRPASGAAEMVEALRHRPNMPSALVNLCILLVSQQDYQSAIPFCEKAQKRGGDVSKFLDAARSGTPPED